MLWVDAWNVFTQGERLLGEEAMALEARFPEKLFLRARELLGQSSDLPAAQAALDRMKLPQKVVAPQTQGNRTTLALSSPDDGQVKGITNSGYDVALYVLQRHPTTCEKHKLCISQISRLFLWG